MANEVWETFTAFIIAMGILGTFQLGVLYYMGDLFY
jgi:hypothetical protein